MDVNKKRNKSVKRVYYRIRCFGSIEMEFYLDYVYWKLSLTSDTLKTLKNQVYQPENEHAPGTVYFRIKHMQIVGYPMS